MTRENRTAEQRIANRAMEAVAGCLRGAAFHSKSEKVFSLLAGLANEFDRKYPTPTTLKAASEKARIKNSQP